MQLIRKITPRTIGCELAKANFLVFGDATKIEEGESEFGPFIRIFGAFKAKNLVTNNEFYSAQAILPGVAQDLIAGAVQGLGPTGGKVRFAIRLWNEDVSRSPGNMMGFVWACETYAEMEAFTALDSFQSEVQTMRLEGPKPGDKPTASSQPELQIPDAEKKETPKKK